MAKLEVDTQLIGDTGNIVVVTMSGILDTETFNIFTRHVIELLKDGFFKFLIDLQGLKFVSNAGISAFIDLLDVIEEKNGRMHFLNMPEIVDRTLTMLGATGLFINFATKDEAVNVLQD